MSCLCGHLSSRSEFCSRNQGLQTQLTKCLSELKSLKENGCLVPAPRQPKSAPLPPLAPNRTRGGGTRLVTRKMALVGEQQYSDVEKDALTRVDHIEKERLFELTISTTTIGLVQ